MQEEQDVIIYNSMQRKYISIDGLRAYAAIGIVLMHVQANMINKPESYNFINSLISQFGWIFILLFMMISAFGLCCGYYYKIKEGKVSINNFYLRRFKKIWPFFAFLVIVDLFHEPSRDALFEAFADLTLAFGLLPNPSINVVGVGWFLGVIFLFYMLFPFYVFLIDNKKRAWFVTLITILFYYVATEYFFTARFVLATDRTYNIFNYMPYFMIGGIIFLYRERLHSINYWGTLFFSMAVLLFVLLMIYLNVFNDIPKMLILLVFDSSLLCVAINKQGSSLLDNPFTHFISNISLEIYLCHMMILRVIQIIPLQKWIDNWWFLYIITFFFTLLGAIALAYSFKKIQNYIEIKYLNN